MESSDIVMQLHKASWLFTILPASSKEEWIVLTPLVDRPFRFLCLHPLTILPNALISRRAGLDNIVWPEEEPPNGFDISEAIELVGVQGI